MSNTEKKVEQNRHQRRRAAVLARRHGKTEAQMKVEASIEAGKEMRKRRVQRTQEAAHVRAVLRKANKVPVITNKQRKEAAERQRRIDAKKRRNAAYARKQAKTV